MIISSLGVNSMESFDCDSVIGLTPKAELHLHIEGTLSPELMMRLSKKNRIKIPYDSIDEIKKAYNFSDLQSFLDVYYNGMNVLQNESDFYELTMNYLERAKSENVLYVEIFFDPQAHVSRGVPFDKVLFGILNAMLDAEDIHGISSNLIMCFLRHLDEGDAIKMLKNIQKYPDTIIGVGLDSSEVDNPPRKFKRVFEMARSMGLLTVAHAGEEGPPEYIWEALNILKVDRIDHGVRCVEDQKLMDYLRDYQIPLTVCPLSNVKLKVFKNEDECKKNFKTMLNNGLQVTINSDDPAYFGGYINDNYKLLDLEFGDIWRVAKCGFESSFLHPDVKTKYMKKVDDVMGRLGNEYFI